MALRDDGVVWAWGQDIADDLGVQPRVARDTPTPWTAVTGVTQLALGLRWGCALRTDGSVWCWGNRRLSADGLYLSDPTRVAGVSGATQIDISYDHGCARTSDGQAHCWGIWDGEAPGTQAAAIHDVARVVEGLTGVRGVSAGGEHSCAWLDDGTAQCWGYDGYGQLGRGTATPRVALPPAPVRGIADVVQIEAGLSNTYVLTSAGRIFAYGELASEFMVGGQAHPTPLEIVVPGRVVQLAAGEFHVCARTAEGLVYCWGSGVGGLPFGPRGADGRYGPGRIEGLDDVVDLAAGAEHTCAARSDATLWCFGLDRYGELGIGAQGAQTVPVRVDLDE